MKFEIIETENGKSVVLENGKTRGVNKDAQGMEYFAVLNKYTKHPFQLFSDRIHDAIRTIREGNGDAIVVRNLFGRSESVVQFLDREYGEKMRTQTLDGYKDAIFAFSVKFGYKESMSGSRFVEEDKKNIGMFDGRRNYIYFETEDEAENAKNKWLTQASEIVKEYEKVKETGDKMNLEAFVQNHFNDDIVSQLWAAIAETKNWELEVVQVIKPEATVKA